MLVIGNALVSGDSDTSYKSKIQKEGQLCSSIWSKEFVLRRLEPRLLITDQMAAYTKDFRILQIQRTVHASKGCSPYGLVAPVKVLNLVVVFKHR